MAESNTLEKNGGSLPLTAAAAPAAVPAATAPYPLPRVTIRFCTQCKWMLRAAYFAQELLSTFSTALGEVALQPSTGGTFVVELFFQDPSSSSSSSSSSSTIPSAPDVGAAVEIQRRVLWDRKVDGGFPETKELKRRVRDAIEPGRNLGHVDRDYGRGNNSNKQQAQEQEQTSGAGAVAVAVAVAADTTTAGTQSQSQSQTGSATKQLEAKGADGEVCEDCR
ncbi:putative selenoprotein domain-containing protein [Eutypa lata UCREL1]|uniref:Putative selenoprotein domain-containing protein n=1 Tax=Eutypa lata (strain UCR-EL1) TaxID=1287681 RepID=M7TMH5_EUTLA|nr:putative selenoprotein domain-containing protein [Eutypa lata UCREL1]